MLSLLALTLNVYGLNWNCTCILRQKCWAAGAHIICTCTHVSPLVDPICVKENEMSKCRERERERRKQNMQHVGLCYNMPHVHQDTMCLFHWAAAGPVHLPLLLQPTNISVIDRIIWARNFSNTHCNSNWKSMNYHARKFRPKVMNNDPVLTLL